MDIIEGKCQLRQNLQVIRRWRGAYQIARHFQLRGIITIMLRLANLDDIAAGMIAHGKRSSRRLYTRFHIMRSLNGNVGASNGVK